ncbi:MAG: low molecular weight phosphatase family protein, partial [Bacteroidota bacterium]
RFAEIYFNLKVKEMGLNWEAFSRGFRTGNPNNVGAISVYAQRGLKVRGIDTYPEKFPEQIQEVDFKNADLIIALKEKEHRPYVQSDFPTWEGKIRFWHIHDLDASGPEEALDNLEKALRTLMEELSSQ